MEPRSLAPPEPSDRIAGPGPGRTGAFAWQRAATLIAAAACALYFLWRVRDVLPPFLIAFFLASLLDPVVSRMQRRGVSRARAVATIYILVFLLIVIAVMVVVPPALNQMGGLANNATKYGAELKGYGDQWYRRNRATLAHLGIRSNPLSTEASGPQGGDSSQSGALGDAARQVLVSLQGAIQDFAGRILWLIIIPLALFYFLLDYRALRAKLISFAPAIRQNEVERMAEEIVEIFGHYFRSLAVVCLFYAFTAGVIFYLLGLKYALFLGIAAGVLYAVPYIGPAIAIASAGIVALTTGDPVMLFGIHTHINPPSIGYALLVVGLFVAMHLSFDYGVTPRVVGGSVGLHPIVNIFALMCGAALFGVWGMLLAVPVAASIQMLLIYFFPKLGEKAPAPSVGASDMLTAESLEPVTTIVTDDCGTRSEPDSPERLLAPSPERLNA